MQLFAISSKCRGSKKLRGQEVAVF